MKKVLIISKAFYPEISPRSFRTTQLANELVRQGCDVTVMLPNLNESYYSEYSKAHDIKFLNIGNTCFDKFTNESIIARIVKRILQLSTEFPTVELSFLLKKVLRRMSDYDLLISIAVPHPIHWGVALAIKKNTTLTKKWVADCGDPFMGCKTDVYKKFFYFKYIEKFWCKKCDFITVPVEVMIDDFYPEFKAKIKIIPQGFDFDEVKINSFKKQNNQIKIIYAGNLVPHFRNPIPLLDYLMKLDIDFKFIFYNDSNIVENHPLYKTGKLEVRNYISRIELIKEMSQADFLVNFENLIFDNKNSNSSKVNYSSPSKLIDYSISKRPVLSIGSKLDEKVILQFLKGDYTNKMQLPDVENYNIKNVAQKFLTL